MAHLWMVNQYAVTPDLPGGTRHIDLGRELVRLGHQVSIFAADVNLSTRRHMKLRPGQQWLLEKVDGVSYFWLRASLYEKNDWRRAWNMLSFALAFARLAPGIAAPPDVVLGSSPHPLAALAGWWLARRFGVLFWLELRDLWPQALVDMGGIREGHPAVRAMRFLERFLCARAQKIVILAEGSNEYLLSRGIAAEKIVFIPNGVRLADFPASVLHEDEPEKDLGGDRRAQARRRYGVEGFTVVYTGAHGPANALDTVLEAARILSQPRRDVVPAATSVGTPPDSARAATSGCPPILFLLVGDGPTKSTLVKKASDLRLSNVRFLDPVPKGQVPELLLAADAALITLRNAAAFGYAVSPNKLFDYLAAARPVLAAIPGAMAQLVEKAGAGVAVPPEDPAALAEAVLHLASLPEAHRLEMGRRGRALVEAEFCREKLAGKLAALLEEIPMKRGSGY